MAPMRWRFDDGGRAVAGFRGAAAGDCVCRAIAIAAAQPYRVVYDALNALARLERPSRTRRGRSSARTGSTAPQWTPTCTPWAAGPGPRPWRLAAAAASTCGPAGLPRGRLVVNLSRHTTAHVDGVIYDLYDPSRAGTRCI
jgi:hypothetical protein